MLAFGTAAGAASSASLGDAVQAGRFPRSAGGRNNSLRATARRSPSASGAANPPASDPALVVIAIHGSSATSASCTRSARLSARKASPSTRPISAAMARPACAATSTMPANSTTILPISSPWCAARHPNAKLVLMGFSSGGGYALHVAALPLGKTFERAVLLSPMLGPLRADLQARRELRQALHAADHCDRPCSTASASTPSII